MRLFPVGVFSVPLALVGVFFSDSIIALFGLEPEVAQIAVEYLEVTMVTSVVMVGLYIGDGVLRGAGDSRTPMWAIFLVQAGALRGLGNTQFPLRVNASGIWIAVGLASLFIHTIGGNLATVWAGFFITAPVMSAILSWRFRRAIGEL